MSRHGSSVDDDLEAENDKAIDAFGEKVKMMKEGVLKIEREVRDQNRLLDDLESAVARGKHWFQVGFQKLSTVTESGISTKASCYIIAVIIVLFLFIYWLVNRRGPE